MKISQPMRIVMAAAICVSLCGGALRSGRAADPGLIATPPDVPPASGIILPASGQYLNLKVLPRNISSKDLQRIMVDEFNEGLGVGCGFCHGEQKDSHKPDYASDAKAEKNIARSMMRMTLQLNKRFFNIKYPGLSDPALTVTCNTCHRGTAHPDANTDAAVSP